ncbi:permease [Mycobacterium sp. 1554424.7]|nr:permease [Mycobacterium sp. 1554424.7]
MIGFFLLLLAVGCLTGITTVLFGFGGGFVTVPAVYAATIGTAATSGAGAMHTAVATSTAIMVVNAASATVASARLGRLRRDYLWPITASIAVGAALGAVAANRAPEALLHILFVGYIAVTIVDSVVRKGFLSGPAGPAAGAPLSPGTATFGGVGIGAVASFLGIGGSVMTVPLLRRKGVPMAEATALANPLSLPVAIVGTVVYALAAPAGAHPGQVGYVSLAATAALVGGSVPTIALAKRVLAGRRIPDRAHALAYLILLGIILVAMVATMVA